MTPSANTYIPARTNPWAPEWMTGIYRPDETPAGFRDKKRDYATALLTVAANTLATNQALPIDNSADFIAREIIFRQHSASALPGAFPDTRIRWRDGFGNRVTSQLVRPTDIEGPIFPELFLERGTTLNFDIFNNDPASAVFIQIILRGVKRVRL